MYARARCTYLAFFYLAKVTNINKIMISFQTFFFFFVEILNIAMKRKLINNGKELVIKTLTIFILKTFHRTLAESATFAPGSKTRMWYFRAGYGEQ